MMRAAGRLMRGRGGTIINILGLVGHEPYHLLTVPSVLNTGYWLRPKRLPMSWLATISASMP